MIRILNESFVLWILFDKIFQNGWVITQINTYWDTSQGFPVKVNVFGTLVKVLYYMLFYFVPTNR